MPRMRDHWKYGAIAGVIGLALVLLGLVVWGVYTHKEGGLLEVCWVGNQAHYVGQHGTCERPEELVWAQEQIPITLTAYSAAGFPLSETAPETQMLYRVADNVNWQVGFTLFIPGGGSQPTEGRVLFGTAFQSGSDAKHMPAGYVQHYQLGARGLLRGDVRIRADVAVSDPLLYHVLEHELLHLAGLEHDDFMRSVMYPPTQDGWDQGQLQTAHITDHDVKLLRSRYRPQPD